MFITPVQNRLLHKLLNETGQKDKKKALVMQYSEGRTEHSGNLGSHEADYLIGYLKSLPVVPKVHPLDKMRKKVISKYREMQYQYFNEAKGREVADMKRINAHLAEHFKKQLNDFNKKELQTVISVLETKFLPWYYHQQTLNK